MKILSHYSINARNLCAISLRTRIDRRTVTWSTIPRFLPDAVREPPFAKNRWFRYTNTIDFADTLSLIQRNEHGAGKIRRICRGMLDGRYSPSPKGQRWANQQAWHHYCRESFGPDWEHYPPSAKNIGVYLHLCRAHHPIDPARICLLVDLTDTMAGGDGAPQHLHNWHPETPAELPAVPANAWALLRVHRLRHWNRAVLPHLGPFMTQTWRHQFGDPLPPRLLPLLQFHGLEPAHAVHRRRALRSGHADAVGVLWGEWALNVLADPLAALLPAELWRRALAGTSIPDRVTPRPHWSPLGLDSRHVPLAAWEAIRDALDALPVQRAPFAPSWLDRWLDRGQGRCAP